MEYEFICNGYIWEIWTKWKQMMEDDDATELVMRNLKWVLENLLLFEKILNFEYFSNNNLVSRL
jgi:hypothetical protein